MNDEERILNEILEKAKGLSPDATLALVKSLINDCAELTVALVRTLQALAVLRDGLQPMGEVSKEFGELGTGIDEIMDRIVNSIPEESRKVIRDMLEEGAE